MDISEVSSEQLAKGRDLGAVSYLKCYIMLMCRGVGVNPNSDAVNGLVLALIEPMNHATEAMWRALMQDEEGQEQALATLKASLDNIEQMV